MKKSLKKKKKVKILLVKLKTKVKYEINNFKWLITYRNNIYFCFDIYQIYIAHRDSDWIHFMHSIMGNVFFFLFTTNYAVKHDYIKHKLK